MVGSMLDVMRSAAWLDAGRARAYVRILLLVAVATASGWLALSEGGLDRAGNAIGTDFTSFYAASRLALAGDPAAAYQPPLHEAAQTAIFGREVPYAAFFYPPTFLLVCLPLAALPYLPALALWLALTGAAYAASVARLLREAGEGLLPAFAHPAVLLNLGHGQNGFLTAALLGGFALLLPSRPLLAGLLVGGLAFKPHLALLLPVGLLLVGAWRTILAAAAATLAFLALSWAVLGEAAWRGFLSVSPLARAALEEDWVGAAKMTSVFAGARLLGLPLGLAYAVQGAVALAILLALVRLSRLRPSREAFGVALVAATPLATPFLLDYDLMILAVPLAWMLREGVRTGFRPWEKLVLAATFVLPLLARPVGSLAGLPLAPLVLAAFAAFVFARAADSRHRGNGTVSPPP